MTALARAAKPTSGLQDICRDWRRWSAAERCSAVTLALALIALHIAIAHSL
jgi:tRNA(Ile)-lysidine synthase TilS/MesJ